jgi:hypothetical protein
MHLFNHLFDIIICNLYVSLFHFPVLHIRVTLVHTVGFLQLYDPAILNHHGQNWPTNNTENDSKLRM